jgi:hypothetical protein
LCSKVSWVSKELNGLKNRALRHAKKTRRCMIDDDIGYCDCERLRHDDTALRAEYQEHHGRAYDHYRIGIEEAIKTDPRIFFFDTLISKKASVLSIGHEF